MSHAVGAGTTASSSVPTEPAPKRARRGGAGINAGHQRAGLLFTAPMVVILGLFMLIPVLMALYVSMTNWNGNGNPFVRSVNSEFVGLKNYTELFSQDSLDRAQFMQSVANTFWYAALVVPLQTISALSLALIVNNRFLKGRGFFRTAFYFPSVTSSIAITTVFLFLFAGSGPVNGFLALFGINGPVWMNTPDGLIHLFLGLFGVDQAPGWAQTTFLSRTLWEWISGPSVALTVFIILAVWTTTGTFMLMFLAALQDLPVEVDEAASLDGVNWWQKLRLVTIPQLRPTIFLVTTLGIIGTWQVFDQIYAGGQGAPGGTTLTPAFLSYQKAFASQDWGTGAAMSFVVFLIIVSMTYVQRRFMDEERADRRRAKRLARERAQSLAAAEGSVR